MSRPAASRARRPNLRGAAARTVTCAAAVLAVAAACSNSSPQVSKNPHTGNETASVSGGVQQVVLTTGPDLRFHPSTITVHPGRVHIVLKNKAPGGGPPHNLLGAKVPGLSLPLVTAGQQTSTTFIAPAPGRYNFVCTIHEAQGQRGVLVVEAG